MAKEILIGSLGVGIVMLGIFLGLSLSSLQYNEIGINYSSYFKSIENSTYYSGFHFIGLGHTFIPYKLNVETMDFSNENAATMPPIDCRTKDGLNLNLEFSFQYRVLPNQIYDIYVKYGTELKTILLRIAIDSISDVGTQYTAYDFFSKRMTISQSMSEQLNTRLQRDVFVEVVYFQLKSVNLPEDYENAIQATEVTKQGILRAQAEQLKNQVTLDMLKQVAVISQNITINDASG